VTGVAEHVRIGLELKVSTAAARSIIRAKLALVNGDLRAGDPPLGVDPSPPGARGGWGLREGIGIKPGHIHPRAPPKNSPLRPVRRRGLNKDD